MAEFVVNPTRVDPLKGFNFRVMWDGRYIAGITKVSVLRRTTEVVVERNGGDANTSHKSPGRTEFDAIVLERGVTFDSAFEDWANKVWNVENQVALADFRKDITIDLFNEADQKVKSYKVYRCWVSAYEPLSTLDASYGGTCFESIQLENEGWERDVSVVEPKEPS